MITTFSEQVKVTKCNAFGTAIVDGDFPASGSYIDVSDYERFAFLITAGASNTALTCQVQQSTTASATPKDVTGAVQTVGASDDGEVFIIEVETRKLDINNDYFYVTLDVSGQSGNDEYLDITFLGINPGEAPVTQQNTAVIIAG